MKGFIAVYLLTAFGVVGSLRTPVIGLGVYVLFAVLRPQYLWGFAGDMSNLSFIVGVAMLAGWMLRGFGEKRFGRGTTVVALLLVFLCWTTASAAQAIDTDVAFKWVTELLKIVAPFLVGVTMLSTSKQARWMIWLIVLAQAYISFEMNLSYYVDGYNRVADIGYGGMDNNSFGISLVATIGPTIALALTEKRWLARGAAAIAGVLILHCTLLTFSRGAMVGLLVVGVTAFVLMPKRPSYVLAMVVAALLTARLTGPQLMARYSTTFSEADERDDSAESRVSLWRDCLDVASKRPLFGVGPRNWPVVAEDYGWPPGKEAHSTWIQTSAEMGFPGALALLMFFSGAAIKLWLPGHQLPNESNRDAVLGARAVVMSIVGFVVAGQFVTLTGLEMPYYMTMIGVVVLKDLPRAAAVNQGSKACAGGIVGPQPGPAYKPSAVASVRTSV
jgi:probable O-glycosylation ligase (exosortase A-associated)